MKDSSSRLFDEEQPHTTAVADIIPFNCIAANFPDAVGTERTCWFEKGVRAPVDETKKLCGGSTTDKVKVMSVYQAGRAPPAHDPSKSCVQKADIVFVLDQSGSVREDNFWKMKISVQDAVRDMKNNGGADVKVALVKFASGALTEIDLTDDLDEVITGITSSQYATGATWTR